MGVLLCIVLLCIVPGRSTVEAVREKVQQIGGGIGEDLLASIPPDKQEAGNHWQKIIFAPQKTAKSAAKYATDNDLADFADYTGIKPEVANAWNQAILEHLREFPELRPRIEFTGTIQRHHDRWYNLRVKEQFEAMRRLPANQGFSDESLMAAAKRRVKKPRANSTWYAMAWDAQGARGISVNHNWGKNPEAFKDALVRDVSTKYHPAGTQQIKAVLDHELGHQLDYMLNLRENPDVKALIAATGSKQDIGEQLSRYGAKNDAEFIAEAWAEYRNNPQPRETASKLGELVKRLYDERTRS